MYSDRRKAWHINSEIKFKMGLRDSPEAEFYQNKPQLNSTFKYVLQNKGIKKRKKKT